MKGNTSFLVLGFCLAGLTAMITSMVGVAGMKEPYGFLISFIFLIMGLSLYLVSVIFDKDAKCVVSE